MNKAEIEEINVLSAGAIKPGLVKVVDAFQRVSSRRVKIAFATAPTILNRIATAEDLDVVIAPPAVLETWANAGKASAVDCVTVGRIGIGVMVRDGVPHPKIGTVDTFKQALISADALVYNQASTGIYLEELFEQLAIAQQLRTKTVRYPDAAAVLDHIGKSTRREIGLGATTVIIEGQNKGLQFVGPLPGEIQNYTTYAATVVSAPTASDAGRQFIRFLKQPMAKDALAAAGIQ
jgi:molybdate transport system substrate-binding protein